MADKIRINTDGATVKTDKQDLIVAPRRIAMIGAAGLIAVIALPVLLLGLSSIVEAFTDFDLENILTSGGMVLLSVGLFAVARFALNRARNQQAIHFDTAQRVVKIGNDTVIRFDDITGVYLKWIASTQLGDISGIVIQTGLISGDTVVPVTSVSKPELSKSQSDAVELVRLYTQYTGHDPKSIGRYEDLINIELTQGDPAILQFDNSA